MTCRRGFLEVSLLVGLAVLVCPLQVWPANAAESTAPSFEQLLGWLPADTEEITVGTGSFVIPKVKPGGDDEDEKNKPISQEDLRLLGHTLALGSFGFGDSLLMKHLKGQTVLLSLEGSRHFRPPSGLGQMLSEDCAIAVFAGNQTNNYRAFSRDPKAASFRSMTIEGVTVMSFQEKLEEDIWTFYAAMPQPNIITVATNEDYLREVLRRMHGAAGPRALPDTLPEWKYVDRQSPAWALRHYDRSQAAMDPSSPYGGEKSANHPDDDAIGIVFQLVPSGDMRVVIRYLSSPKGARMLIPNIFAAGDEPETTKAMQIRTREIVPGVVEGSYRLASSDALSDFLFGLLGAFGHAVYL